VTDGAQQITLPLLRARCSTKQAVIVNGHAGPGPNRSCAGVCKSCAAGACAQAELTFNGTAATMTASQHRHRLKAMRDMVGEGRSRGN
jgi:hypothetical protein